jgi:hypothetical protein
LKSEKAPAASACRVYVNDLEGHVVKRSDELPSETTEWKVTEALKRDYVYVWTVSMRSLEQLNMLKKTRSHLALGVFYANAGLTAEKSWGINIKHCGKNKGISLCSVCRGSSDLRRVKPRASKMESGQFRRFTKYGKHF